MAERRRPTTPSEQDQIRERVKAYGAWELLLTAKRYLAMANARAREMSTAEILQAAGLHAQIAKIQSEMEHWDD